MIVDGLQHDRVVGSDTVELVAREAARIVGELLLRPASEHHDPFAGWGGLDAIGEQLERVGTRGDAVEAQFVVFGGANPVGVIVDEAGDDGASREIYGPRLRTSELIDIRIGADRDDALAADRQRLRDGKAVVDGDDLAVDENEIGALRRGDQGKG